MQMMDREAWILLGGITTASTLVALLPFRWPRSAKRSGRSIITTLVIWLGSWGAFIAASLVLAAVTKGRPPYALVTNLGLVGVVTAHGWLAVTPFRQREVILRAVGPLLALVTYIIIVVMLLAPVLPEAYMLQGTGTSAYWIVGQSVLCMAPTPVLDVAP